jgi:hypothetical protein
MIKTIYKRELFEENGCNFCNFLSVVLKKFIFDERSIFDLYDY